MDDALKILVLEDVAADAELMLHVLQRSGVQCHGRIVAHEADFRRCLDEFEPDIILSDSTLPGFDVMSALSMARERRPDTPFLFVSSTIGERAVETLKEGASDYVMKGSLQRLPVAVQKAQEAQRSHAAKRETEAALRDSEARYRGIVNSVRECIITVDERQRIVEFNPAAESLFGYARAEMIGKHLDILVSERSRAQHEEIIRKFAAGGQNSRAIGQYREITGLRADGREFTIEATISQLGVSPDKLLTVILRDVTERRRDVALLHAHRERLQALSRRLMQMEENERRRLARELHDRIGQNVSALSLNLNLVRSELLEVCPQKVKTRLDDCEALLFSTAKLVQDVLADLRPPGLDELGLIAALNEHARQVAARGGFSVTVNGTVISPRLPPATEITLFRIVQEALTNIVKHAGATEVTLTLESRAGAVVLTIADNGCGFDTAVRPHVGRLGIVGMRERAESIGAWLRVESTGQGTRVIVEAPGAAPAPPEIEPG